MFVGTVETRLIDSWSPTTITAHIPSGAAAGVSAATVRQYQAEDTDPLVEASGGSITVSNYILPKTGWSYQPGAVRFEVVRGADPAAVALSHGDQAPKGASPAADASSGEPINRFFVTQVAQGTEAAAIKALALDGRVEWAEPVLTGLRAVSTRTVPNDTLRSGQTELAQLDAQTAWDQVKTGPRIAEIDSGVVTTHEDLAGKVDLQRDYTGVASGDTCGHGTNVAGVLAANTNNARGMASISWGAHLGSYIALYCTTTSQNGNDTMMANAMNAAVADGSKVISSSLAAVSPGPCSGYLQAAVTNVVNNGRFFVNAAGNSTTNQAGWPNSCSGTYSVGSVGSGDSYSSFSNYGPWVSLAAPGENITVTATTTVNANAGCPNPSGYSMCNGTSFAAPLVATVANDLYQLGATRADVITYLGRHAKAITCPYGGGQCGAGRLQAGLTVQAWHFGSGVAGKSTSTGAGYWLFDSKGVVGHFGDAGWCGDPSDIALAKPVVGGDGGSNSSYILFAQDGGVFNYCGQGFYGSMGGRPLNCNIVGGRLTPSSSGYWEVGCDGGIFNFGDAQFLGSMGGHALNCAVVGMDRVPFGQGYWEVGCDGGIFNYGNAGFFGSMGGHALNAPITGIAATSSGQGYWEVARDGGIFAFGDAQFLGSMGGQPNVPPIVGLITFGSTGYCEVGNNGALYCFGSAQYMGNGL